MPEGPENQSPIAADDTIGSGRSSDLVGYYDTSNGSGAARQTASIEAGGYVPQRIVDLSAAELEDIAALVVQNPNNGAIGGEYLNQRAEIFAAVQEGMVLVFHDRNVSTAQTALPEAAGIDFRRDTDRFIELVDDAHPISAGPGGVVNDTSLDNGSSSNHGYALRGTLPAGAETILTTNNENEAVTFAYEFGAGAVVYSSIPLDYYLTQSDNLALRFQSYAANIIDYAMTDLAGTASLDAASTHEFDSADLLENDADPDDEAVTISGVSSTSALGAVVTLAGDGTITYDPTGVAELQALAEDAALEDSFTYTISDGFGGTDSATVTLSVAGPDADPVLTGTLEDQSAYFGVDFSLVIPFDLFTDLSGGRLTYDVALADGGALPEWLSFDAATRTLGFDDADMSPAQVGDLDLRVTATEDDGQASSLTFGLSVVGPELLIGTEGPDALTGLAGPDTLIGLGGDDTLLGGDSGDDINGGGGNDSIDGGSGNDTIGAGDGNDTVEGGIGFDQIFGGAGDDSLSGGAGRDLLNGMDGNDTLEGGTQDDTLGGQAGNDSLMGGEGHDFLAGGADNDTLRGDDGIEGNFRDTLYGGAGEDLLFGGGGHDRLYGGDDDDLLLGSYGDDVLDGGAGDDFLFGGLGRDTVTGGDGADRFFVSGADQDRIYITDFDPTEGDVIVFDGTDADRSDFTFAVRSRSEIDDLGNETLIYDQRELLYNGRAVVTFLGDDPIPKVTLRLPDPSDTGQIVTFDLG